MKVIGNCTDMKQIPSGRKSLKLLQHLIKPANQQDFKEMPTTSRHCSPDLNTSEIIILNGSFSKVKPIGSTRKPLIVTSTPKYEEISEPEENEPEQDEIDEPLGENDPKKCPSLRIANINSDHGSGDSFNCDSDDGDNENNVTFNYMTDVMIERKSCDDYIKKLNSFITASDEFVQRKKIKKAEILRKLKKYERKIKKVQQALNKVDDAILLGSKVSRSIKE